MKYRDRDYAVNKVVGADGTTRFQWKIYEKAELGPNTVGPDLYGTHDAADRACQKAIDDGFAAKKGATANRA